MGAALVQDDTILHMALYHAAESGKRTPRGPEDDDDSMVFDRRPQGTGRNDEAGDAGQDPGHAAPDGEDTGGRTGRRRWRRL
jgi:hypothetical protein